MCVPKSNSNDKYAITCDVIAYHLVNFLSIQLINKCQSGIDFIFTSERAIYSSFMKIPLPSPVFRGKTQKDESETMQSIHARMSTGDEICFRYNKIREFDTLERQTMGVSKYASTFPMASCNKKRCNHRKRKCGVKKYKNTQLFLQVRN